MSNATRRRNGLQASCEPCRLGKVRCDHRKPVCSRCQRRDHGAKCWYHPAPLTAKCASSVVSRNSPARGQTDPAPLHQSDSSKPPVYRLWPFNLSDASVIGSTSSLAGTRSIRAREERLLSARAILAPLAHMQHLEQLLDDYFDLSQTAMVPKPLVKSLLRLLRGRVETSGLGVDDHLASDLLTNTESVVAGMPLDLDVDGFCAIYSGDELRVETLGLLYALAVRASLSSTGSIDQDKDPFLGDLLYCTHLSLRLSREVAPQSNDVIIWLGYETLQIMSYTEGEASITMWRGISALTADLLALGLHREESYDKVPFFVAECRRKAFAAAFHLDKLFTIVFSRPPRLPSRYTDCKMPLDISNEVLFAATADAHLSSSSTTRTSAASINVSPDGWSLDKLYRSTTWARLRYLLATVREEVVDIKLSPLKPSDGPKLRDIAARCDVMWNNLPEHLRYDPRCWTSGRLAPGVCVMLGKVYLLYLNVHFQICQLLYRIEGQMPAEIYTVSANVVETVVQRATVRNAAILLPHDVPGVVLGYGLPCAVFLGSTLQSSMRDQARRLPMSLSRSKIVRNLSVMVSQLESVASAQQSNHDFCIQAARGLANILDGVLDGAQVTAHSSASDAGSVPDLESGALPQYGLTGNTLMDETLSMPLFADFSNCSMQDADEFGFFNLGMGFDWMASPVDMDSC